MENVQNWQNYKQDFQGARHTTKQLNRTKFDLSHDVKTTITMGRVYPVLLLETMPGDSFTVSTDIMARFLPLYLPVMHTFTMELNYFYIPYRILWRGWEAFFSDPAAAEAVTIPTINISFTQVGTPDPCRTLLSYLGYPVPIDPADESTAENINAMPIAAYYKVIQDFYRDKEFNTIVFTNLSDAGQTTTLATKAKDKCMYDMWNKDYFTSATNVPAKALDLSTPVTFVPDNILFQTSTGNTIPTTGSAVTIRAANADGTAAGSAQSLGIMYPAGTSNYLQFTDEQIQLNLDELRYNMRMYEYLEKLTRVEPDYRSMLSAFYGVDPDPASISRPQWFGGWKSKIVIGEVMSTAETATYVVGGYAGQAIAVERGEKANIFCPEFGLILGLLSYKPRSSYFQGVEKLWMRSTQLDLPLEHFAGIGDQPILRKELIYRNTTDPQEYAENTEVFGYIPRYSEWRYKNDIVTGQMRDIFTNFHAARKLTIGADVLDEDFLLCKDIDVTNIFQVQSTEDECFIHMYHTINVERQLPAYSIPQF